jgi:hypothetical protein
VLSSQLFAISSKSLPTSNSSIGRPRQTWENTVEKDIKETGYGNVNGNEMVQERDEFEIMK